jgi:hypothetical protein
MAAEETAAATKETTAPEPEKKKEIAEDTLEDEIFNFQNLVGQELKEYAISCGYRPGALLFGGVDDEKLGCVRDHTGAKVIGTLSKSIGFPKLKTDISRYRRQHIVSSLFYSNFKVNNFSLTFIVSTTKMFSNEGCVGPVLRRRRSFRKKQPSAEAVCVRWSKVPLHEASVLQTDLKIE